MPKKKKQAQSEDKLKPFFFGIIVGLTIIALTLMAVIQAEKHRQTSRRIHVSLGAMRYDFSSGKAVKRSDDTVKNLKGFLVDAANESLSENCEPHYAVMAASDDEKQVLLGYGCGSPSARMFAVNENSKWRTISPTNQFDVLGIPSCEHVNGNAISQKLAPVCVNGLGGEGTELTYTTR